MLVMTIILSLPLFSVDYYTDTKTSYETGAKLLSLWYNEEGNGTNFNACKDTYIN